MPSVVALVAGLLLPFTIVWKEDADYHHKDYAEFAASAECWLHDSRNIYLNCYAQTPNYPVVGVLASAGALSGLKTISGVKDNAQVVGLFRFYLAIFGALNFILVWQLARLLKLRHAVWIGLLIAALPSSWAGGELWGQIDGISQFFLLACICCFIVSIQSDADRHSIHSFVYFACGLLMLVVFLLTKQFAVFSLPAIGALALLAGFKLCTSGSKLYGVMATVAASLLAFALFWFLDSRLEVPGGYYGSSYLFVWLGGGSSKKIHHFSHHGFNIWRLLINVNSDPSKPFGFAQLRDRDYYLTPFITPLYSGIALYISYVFAITASYFAIVWKQALRPDYLLRDSIQMRFIIATLVLYIAQVNLGFNVLLPGTHERYLCHFFPFLILSAFFFLQQKILFSICPVLFFIGVALMYGCYVSSAVHLVLFQVSVRAMATASLLLLGYLFVSSFRLIQYSKCVASPTGNLARHL